MENNSTFSIIRKKNRLTLIEQSQIGHLIQVPQVLLGVLNKLLPIANIKIESLEQVAKNAMVLSMELGEKWENGLTSRGHVPRFLDYSCEAEH